MANGATGSLVKIVGTVAIAALWLSSMPFAAFIIERPLAQESLPSADGADYIYVLSGGTNLVTVRMTTPRTRDHTTSESGRLALAEYPRPPS